MTVFLGGGFAAKYLCGGGNFHYRCNGCSFAASGFDAAVRALARKQLELLQEKTAHGQHVPAYHYVMAYTRLGDTEQAFSWMKKTVEEPSWFALQLGVNPLRSDPRFEALLSQVFSKNR